MRQAPLVTIGLPVYNGERFLERAIESLRAQDHPNLEIVISDNASTDQTNAICSRHAAEDPRIRLIRQPENIGPHGNFEAVLREARGAYFMWAADDDVWLPTFVSRLLAELEAHPEAGVAMCAVRRVEEDGRPFDELRFGGRDDLAKMGAIARGLVLLTPKKHSLFIYGLFRSQLAKRSLGHFPRELGGDRMLMFHFALATPMRYVDEFLYIRTHRQSHANAYLRASKSFRTRFGQFVTFCKSLVVTPVVPVGLKLCLPFFALIYAGFLVRREAFEMKLKMKNLLSRVLRGQLELAAVGIAVGIALLGYIASAAAGGVGNLITVLPLGAVWLLLGLLGIILAIGLAKLIRYRRLWLSGLDRNHLAVTRLVGGVGATTSAGISDVHLALADLTRRQEEIERFAKFTTDVMLAPETAEAAVEREAWSYGLNNRNTVRKQVAFARALEASRIRELYLHEIFPGIETVPVPVGVINEMTGHPNAVDMVYVCAIAKFKQAKNIFEFGTYQGRTTFHLAQTSDDTRVTTLDLPPDPDWAYSKYNGIYFRGKPIAERITQTFSDSRRLKTAPLAKQFDFVFVDADHSYEAVKNDTVKAFELMKPGGIIMWHDYAPKSAGLVQFFQEFTQKRPLFRIKRTCLLLHIDGVDPMTFEPAPMLPSLELAHQATDRFQVEQTYHH